MLNRSSITASLESTAGRRASLLVVLGLVILGLLAQPLISVVSAQPSESPAAAPGTAASGAWEYRTLFVTWDSEALDWVVDFSDGTRTEGLDQILDNEGAAGWHLVSVVPELSVDLVIDNVPSHDVRRLRIFLERPLA